MRGSPNTPERFWSHVDRSGGPDSCWPWMFTTRHPRTARDSRGVFSMRGHQRFAYHYAWEFTHGEIPAGQKLCHTCDNGLCCNPAHLWLGTQTDNLADMTAKGRRVRGERVGNSKLTEEQVVAMRRAYLEEVPVVTLAEQYGIHWRMAYSIISGHRWAHVPGAAQMRPRSFRHRIAEQSGIAVSRG